jgi:TATA-box binding protein (TBP) (component of TFIID and TFIIIB)
VSRSHKPITTNSCFDTGRILITGASSIDASLMAAHQFVDKINTELGSSLMLYNFKVQNLVSSFSLGYPINIDLFATLEKIGIDLSTAKFAPSNFLGLCWRPVTGCVFVIFDSGRGVLTGAVTLHEAHTAYQAALPVFKKYHLGHEVVSPDAYVKLTRPVDKIRKRTKKKGSTTKYGITDEMRASYKKAEDETIQMLLQRVVA